MVLVERDREKMRLGRYAERVALIRKFRERFDSQTLAEICDNNPKLLTSILDSFDAHPDWDDTQIAKNVDFT